MAGLALIYAEDGPASAAAFSGLVEATAGFKHLETPSERANSGRCLAAKLDAPCSLHRGLVRHPQTGAWLLAAGTLIDPADLRPDGSLERLLGDYLERGAAALSRLDGQFALAIYDPRQETLTLVSDPFGMISLYYSRAGGHWYISTSALAIAKALQPQPDALQARAFVLHRTLLGGTLWQGIHRLPPATALTISPDGAAQETYWSFQLDPEIADYSEDQAADCLLGSFSQSMRQGLAREGEMWVSLTGGLDSRTLAALTAYSRLPFKAYCHGPRDARDVQIAEHISREMGWEYEYFSLPVDWGRQRCEWLSRAVEQTDGELDSLKLTRTIREQTLKARQMGVSLWGYGGEIYRGVYWKQEFWRAGSTANVDYDRLLDFRLRTTSADMLEDGLRWQDAVRQALRSELRAVGERRPDWPNTVKLDLIGLRLERQDCGGTIAAVLGQQRVPLPFDFKENLQRAISVNYQWRAHSRLFRLLLKRIDPRLAGIDTADGGPASPMRLSNAHRFVPYWLDAGEKLAWNLGFKYLGRPLWRKRNLGQDGKAYPTRRWFQETAAQLTADGVLLPEKMCSAGLYLPGRLKAILDSSQAWTAAQEALISRIFTLEMVLRLAGTGC